MDCTQAQARLHDATRPGTAASHDAELAEHLRDCSACQALVGEPAQLQAAWRAIPLPAEAERGRAAFLDRLPMLARERGSERTAAWPRWVVAAVLFLAVGSATWLLWPSQPALRERSRRDPGGMEHPPDPGPDAGRARTHL